MNWKKIDLDLVNSANEEVETARRDSLTDKSQVSQKPLRERGDSDQLDDAMAE